MPDKATPIGKNQTLGNARIERLPVITSAAINPVPTPFETVPKRFIFLANFSLLEISSKK